MRDLAHTSKSPGSGNCRGSLTIIDIGVSAMASLKFTFTLPRLKDLEPEDKAYVVRDTAQPALQAKVTPAGIVTLLVRRRPRGSAKVVTVAICKLSDGWTVKRIRDQAVEILGQFNMGVNPNTERKRAAAENAIERTTLQQAFDLYINGARNQHTGKPLTDRVKHNYPVIFERDFKAWLDAPMVSIKPVDTVTAFDRIEKEVGPVAAAKALSIFRAAWNFANKLHKSEDSIEPFGKCPIWKLYDLRPKWNKPGVRKRKVSADDLPEWLAAVRNIDQVGALYFEALLLTGARRNEIAGMAWEQVDLKRKTITFLSTKNGSDHTLPITRRMRELLLESRRKYPYIKNPFRMLDPTRVIHKVNQATGIEFSSHDIRRTFTTLADRSGAGSFAIKAILNHSSGADVTQTHYAQYGDAEDLRDPLQEIENYILSKAKVYRDNVLQVVK